MFDNKNNQQISLPNQTPNVQVSNQPIPDRAAKTSPAPAKIQPQAINTEIHTMKKDLAGGGNSSYPNSTHSTSPQQPEAPGLNNKQKTSPFLSSNQEEPAASEKTALEKPSPTKSILITAIIVFLVLALGIGGYYYWINQASITEPALVIPEQTTPTEVTPVEVDSTEDAPEAPAISTTSPNYMVLQIEADKTQIKNTISDYAQKAIALNSSSPIEFIVADQDNNPIGFSTFSQRAGLALSAAILSQLGDEFSIFVYREKDTPHLGLSVELAGVADKAKLQSAMLKEEPSLANEISPMFLVSSYTIENKSYSTNAYGGAEVRFINIISPEELSVDYTVFKNNLIFATTKMTMRSIIDRLNSASETSVSTSSSSSTDIKKSSSTSSDKDASATSKTTTSTSVNNSTTTATPSSVTPIIPQ